MANELAPVVRDATPDDAPGILALIEAAYGTWPKFELDVTPLEHLKWKMAPGDGLHPTHIVILIDDQIVVWRLRWQNHIQIGGRTYLNETGADLAVHPQFQGRGLARLMVDTWTPEFLANPKASLGMVSSAPEVRTMDYPDTITRPVTTWHRPFGPRAYLGVHRRGGLAQLAQAIRAWRRAGRQPHLPAGSRIELVEQFDARIDELWERARPSFDVIPHRTAAYLNWRFARPASGNPELLALTRGDRALAYAAVKRTGTDGQLQDFLWAPDEPEALTVILEAAAHRLRRSGAAGVTCWLPGGHRAETALRRAGFAPVGEQRLVVGTETRGETPPEALAILRNESRSIHVTMSDFDWV